MTRLQLVQYPLREVLFVWKQIGDMFGEEDTMLLPEVFYGTDQTASERAEGCGWQTLTFHASQVNLDAHVIVAPGILGMGLAVLSMLTSPVPFIPISDMLLLQYSYIAGIRFQKFLRGFGEGKDHNIFHSHQLRVEVVILVSAVLSFKISDV